MKIFFYSEEIKRVQPLIWFFLFIFSFNYSLAQSKTNLEIFYSLTDSISGKISSTVTESPKEIKVKFNLGEYDYIFSNQIISSLQKNGFTVHPENNNTDIPSINIVMDMTKVEYGEIFRDGMFGDLLLERKISIAGNFTLVASSYNYFPFTFSFSDTISVGEIPALENESFPFSQGNIPAEPFLSSLIEPAIVLSTAAVSVILFFTIRSK